LFLIGVALAAGLNVNAISITDHLARNKALRESLVARANAVTHDSFYVKQLSDSTFRLAEAKRANDELNALDLPIGIERYSLPRKPADWVRMFGGILITAFAVTLGAPFWFDALNKMMVIRSTVKPHEKSPEESSEDRQTSKDKSSDAPPPSEAPKPAAAVVAPRATAPPEPPPVTIPEVRGEPHEWASGKPDEGVL
jgi:hypothetical protein